MEVARERESSSSTGQRRQRCAPPGQETLAEIQARCPEEISGQDYYARLSESGIQYGPFFQTITQLWRHGGNVLGESASS